jgi:predicted Ser/Thr protein kinase
MIALDDLCRELISKPTFRDTVSMYRGSQGEFFVKLSRRSKRRFLLRNEARFAKRFQPYDFCPSLIGFRDFEDASFLVYRRVTGVSLMNIFFATEHMVSLVSDALDRIKDMLAREQICQLDPSPNNIIIYPRSGRVWYVDYELCAPFDTETEITRSFALSTEEEKQVLSKAFQTAACPHKPASMTEYGDAFNRYMNKRVLEDLERRQRLTGMFELIAYKLRHFWQRANQQAPWGSCE